MPEKGCVAAQLCLTPGEAQPNPVWNCLHHTKRPRRGRTYLYSGCYSPPTGDGSAGVMTTPGSASLRSPRPALSIIGQLRSPFSHFDKPSKKLSLLKFGIVEPPVSWKDSANRAQYKKNVLACFLYCRGAAYLMEITFFEKAPRLSCSHPFLWCVHRCLSQ